MSGQIKNILILSASIGSGHDRAANALAGALQNRYPLAQITVVDFMDGERSYLSGFMKETYLRMLRLSPNIYDVLYRWTQSGRQGTGMGTLMARVLQESMLEIIETYQPDWLIATHPFSCGAAAYLKRKGKIDIPLAGVITDFAVHRLWVYPEVDCYFVAVPELREALLAQGVAAAKVNVTGIPIDSRFSQAVDRSAAGRRLGLATDRYTVLLMGGGLGLGGVSQAIRVLNEISLPLQLVVVAGKNRKLYKKLKTATAASGHPVKLLSYTSQVPELMAAANVLITKPGALTISEALSMKLPMLLYAPIPGQEKENAAYLDAKGAAFWVKNDAELKRLLTGMIVNGNIAAFVQENAKKLGQPRAAETIAAIISRRFDKRGIVAGF